MFSQTCYPKQYNYTQTCLWCLWQIPRLLNSPVAEHVVPACRHVTSPQVHSDPRGPGLWLRVTELHLTVWQSDSLTVLQSDSLTVWQYYSLTVWQYYSLTVQWVRVLSTHVVPVCRYVTSRNVTWGQFTITTRGPSLWLRVTELILYKNQQAQNKQFFMGLTVVGAHTGHLEKRQKLRGIKPQVLTAFR